jgi:hypothetical protein
MLNGNDAEPLSEQEISHPDRQHGAQAIADELESFEKTHASLPRREGASDGSVSVAGKVSNVLTALLDAVC